MSTESMILKLKYPMIPSSICDNISVLFNSLGEPKEIHYNRNVIQFFYGDRFVFEYWVMREEYSHNFMLKYDDFHTVLDNFCRYTDIKCQPN